jgi:2-polyprenyl-3-methyl-5-hydroxy-6-metoxy-1,4-benzoquinol methylase
MEKDLNEKVKRSWNDNAASWVNAVRSEALESRRLVTNDAILKTVLRLNGQRILDVGCGEGWLSHKLMEAGHVVAGFDSSSELVEQARRRTDAKFFVLSYEEFARAPYSVGHDFDIAVCNFSLLGETIAPLLRSLHQVIRPAGHLLIQTVHPFTASEKLPYQDGWREETFEGFPGEWSAMPWYFRTMSSWMREVISAAWHIVEWQEPLHPVTGKPTSLILEAKH